VPLILFHPQWKIPQQTQHQLAQQIDILPTILDILNIQVPEKNYLNQSLFVPGNRSVVFYNDLKYRLLQKDKLMTADQNLEHFQFYSFQDPAESIPLVLTREEQLPYINTLKAHVQYFSEGLWDNRLYYPVAK
jgi:arylsulfatase A-like enzyme